MIYEISETFAKLPNGIFRTLIDIWRSVLGTFVDVFSWVGRASFTVSGIEFNVFATFLGSSLTVYMGICIVRWVKQTILA